MSTGDPALLTVTSFVSKPIEEKINVTGKLVTEILKLPFSSVKVPRSDPLIITELQEVRRSKFLLCQIQFEAAPRN